MPPPLLSTLGARARQAYPIIQLGVREGLTANSILTGLRQAGLGIRRQSLLEIVRAELGIIQASQGLRTLRRDFIPDPRRLPDALTKIRRAFSFTVRITGMDVSTGENLTQNVTVSLDTPLTRGEIEARAIDFIDADFERYGMEVFDVLPVRGMKAGDEGTLLGGGRGF